MQEEHLFAHHRSSRITLEITTTLRNIASPKGNTVGKTFALSNLLLFSPWESRGFCAEAHTNVNTLENLGVQGASYPGLSPRLSLVASHRATSVGVPVASSVMLGRMCTV